MERKKLAVIIPAYKKEFFKDTLQSLVNQTNQDFMVYVGDDCSPEELSAIVDSFKDKLAIRYVRFPENLGGKDLIAHWNRCLDMMQGEEFFCFFSDDDLMEPQCIEQFYTSVARNPSADVFHFDINIIDGDGKLIHECAHYPEQLSSVDFFRLLYSYQIDARMPEFVFRTESFRQHGGFVRFDLAYRSDNATVMACAYRSGICTVPSGRVLWRDSGKNISSKKSETNVMKYRKMMATIDFMNWLDIFFKKNKLVFPFSKSQTCELVLSELIYLYPGYSLAKLTRILWHMDKVRKNPFLFLYYWVHMVFKLRKTISRHFRHKHVNRRMN